jgi:hypothetical protein
VPKYKVHVYDNFHYMDPEAEWDLGVFDTPDEALKAAKRLVDDFLHENWKSGIAPKALFQYYQSFGDDPAIYLDDGGDDAPPFSAWAYAKIRAFELCANSPAPSP